MKYEKNKIWGVFKFLSFLGVWILAPYLAVADPPPWAPAHGYRDKQEGDWDEHHEHHKHYKNYHYVYYPAHQIYYSQDRGGYYYLNNGAWVFGVQPPIGIQLGKSVSIQLGGPVPYVYHPTVIQQYPAVIIEK